MLTSAWNLYFGNMRVSNIVSEFSQFPNFQSRRSGWYKSFGLIVYYLLSARRITYSRTTVRLQLYDYIGYSCTTTEFWISEGISKICNTLIIGRLCIFTILLIFSKKYFPSGNSWISEDLNHDFVKKISTLKTHLKQLIPSFDVCPLIPEIGLFLIN